ncbi:MAG: glycosyltransferase [Flavobacterium sp.]|nr:glycosyltransferase [Flavobacterium sp.]
MNILLVGEYSRLHNSLKEGLEQLGHNVVIIGFSDGFKGFSVDFPLEQKWNSGLLKKGKVLLYKLTGFNITSWFTYRQFRKYEDRLTNFDVVQIINENAFYCGYFYEKKMLQFLFQNNKKVFLMCCGTDYTTVNYYFENPSFMSLLPPYLEGKIKAKNFEGVLKFRRTAFKKTHDYLYKNIQGVIASDLDYHIPMQGKDKYLGMIPNPINSDKIAFAPLVIEDKIVIFHGINSESYFKKGNDYFEEALAIIEKKYPNQVEIITTRSIPYAQYIDLYNRAHILLDMVYGYDQGFHALEAMAKGKVVFTCAEKEFYDYYQLQERVNINARPDVPYLVDQLSQLIENPNDITEIGKNARKFVEKEHNYITSAAQYCSLWQTKNK